MQSPQMALEFEWDSVKAARNLRRNGVSFDAVATVFRDSLSLAISDPAHSDSEDRFIDIGRVRPHLIDHGIDPC